MKSFTPLVPENDLKARLKASGLNYRDVGNHLRESSSTVANRLNGFTRLPDPVRVKIEELIALSAGKSTRA